MVFKEYRDTYTYAIYYYCALKYHKKVSRLFLLLIIFIITYVFNSDQYKMDITKRKTSKIWDHFTPINEISAKCDICGAVMSYKTSVTNLRRHVQRKHPTITVSTELARKATNNPSVDAAAKKVRLINMHIFLLNI